MNINVKYFLLIVFLSFFYVLPIKAAIQINRNMESYVVNVPERFEKNLFELTHYITKPYGNAYEKAQAIAYYISSHMIYEGLQDHENEKIKKRKAKPKKFFKTKSGKSGDFATLFSLMCKQAGVTAGVELGYMVDAENMSKRHRKKGIRHAWNYFVYHHRRIYVDTSLMASSKQIGSNEKKENTTKQIHAINPFYFDFTPEQEEKLHFKKHVSR